MYKSFMENHSGNSSSNHHLCARVRDPQNLVRMQHNLHRVRHLAGSKGSCWVYFHSE